MAEQPFFTRRGLLRIMSGRGSLRRACLGRAKEWTGLVLRVPHYTNYLMVRFQIVVLRLSYGMQFHNYLPFQLYGVTDQVTNTLCKGLGKKCQTQAMPDFTMSHSHFEERARLRHLMDLNHARYQDGIISTEIAMESGEYCFHCATVKRRN